MSGYGLWLEDTYLGPVSGPLPRKGDALRFDFEDESDDVYRVTEVTWHVERFPGREIREHAGCKVVIEKETP